MEMTHPRSSGRRASATRCTAVLLPLCVVLTAGCGGETAQSMARTRDPGDANAAPSMLTLPTLDVEQRDLSETMRFAWTLTEQTFQLGAPPPPSDRASVAEVEAWTNGELRNWLAQKTRLVEAARAELNTAAEENLRQRILGGAFVGLMYEDISRVMLSIPVPREIQEDAEVAPIYQHVIEGHARPFLVNAQRNYAACRDNAINHDGMAHWSRFCDARRDLLPGGSTSGSSAPASGETTVSITRE